jgi:hypothetical protein
LVATRGASPSVPRTRSDASRIRKAASSFSGHAAVHSPLRTQAPAKAIASAVPAPSRRMTRTPAITASGPAAASAGVRGTIGQAR